jgi:putative membrane protein
VSPIAQAAALIAAAIHVLFFVMESLRFSEPATYRRFFVTSDADAALLRGIFFNQGFYNLFLAIGAAAGVVLVDTGSVEAGSAVVLFACGSMFLAGIVLVITDRRFVRAALLQSVPPLIAILAAILL